MILQKETPDGSFLVTIESEATKSDDKISGESMYQLVQLLEQVAHTLRLAVDPDLQRK